MGAAFLGARLACADVEVVAPGAEGGKSEGSCFNMVWNASAAEVGCSEVALEVTGEAWAVSASFLTLGFGAALGFGIESSMGGWD